MNNVQLPTPYFVVQKSILDEGTELLVDSLQKYWNNYIMGYSFKTNALPWVLTYFRDHGFFAEVVSDDEYELAKLAGYPKNCIIYNGPIKTRESFLEALDNGCIVNVDAKRELVWLEENNWQKEVKIGIRVNFDIEKMCPGESACGDEGGRFGFCYENGELENALKRVQAIPNVVLAGIHLHCSSKTRSVNIYKAIAKMACEIKKKYRLELEYIDIGGGFFGGMDNRPKFPDYLKEMSEILATEFAVKDTAIIVEPGMSLIGPAIDFVTSVIDVKTTDYNRFVITDGSRNNIDPLMTKTGYFYDIETVDAADAVIEEKQIICGFTCMEHDRLFEMRQKAALQEGDKIIYHKVGGYTMCLSPLFIKYFPDVYVYEAGEYTQVRKRWDAHNYIQNAIM